jgi:hypothetical protein
MHDLRLPLTVVACAALLGSQLGGLHTHVDAYGFDGVPSGMHVHRTAVSAHESLLGHHANDPQLPRPGDPDHDGDHDVLIKLFVGAAKLLILVALFGLGLVMVLQQTGRVRLSLNAPPPKPHRDRWRPPLRAPPLVSLTLSH